MDLSSRLRNFFANRAQGAVQAVEQAPQAALNFGGNLIKNAGGAIGNAISQPFQQAGFNQQQGIQNTNPLQNVAAGIGRAQNFVESPQSFKPIPTVTPFRGNNVLSNIGNFGANLPGDLINGVVAPTANFSMDVGSSIGRAIGGRPQQDYTQLKSPFTRLIANGMGDHANPSEILGNIGGATSDVLSTYTPNIFKGIGEDALKYGLARRSLITALKPQIYEGALTQGVAGLGQGLNEGRGDSLPSQLLKGAAGGAEGLATGGLLAGGVGTAGFLGGKTKLKAVNFFKSQGFSDKKAEAAATTALRDELGRFIGREPVNEPTPPGLMNNMLAKNEPVTPLKREPWQVGGKYGKEYTNITPEMRMAFRKHMGIPENVELPSPGLSIKSVDSKKLLNEKAGWTEFTPHEQIPIGSEVKMENGKQYYRPYNEPQSVGNIMDNRTTPPGSTLPDGSGDVLGSEKSLSGVNKIGQSPEQSGTSLIQGIKDKANELYTQTLDRFHPLSQLAKRGGDEQAMRNALTQHYGAGSTANYHVDYQLAPILKSVDAHDLRDYTIAQRDMELAGRDIKGSDSNQAARTLENLNAKYGGNLQPLDNAASKLYDYQKNLVKTYLVDTGVISKEHFDNMTAQNQKYVPFKRVMDEVDNFLGATPQKKGVGSVGSQNIIKGIKGSDRQIHDPLESIVENTYKIVGLGRRNQVAKTIASLHSALPEVVQPFKGGEVGNKPVISVLDNGKTTKYLVPKDVAEAAKGLNEEALNTVIKILSKPTALLRATATGLNPEFMIPNVVRDYQSAFVNAGLNPLGFVQGLSHMLKQDAVYQDFLKAGGKTSTVSLDRPFLKKTVEDLTSSKAGIDWSQMRKPLSMLQTLGELSEQPTRIAVYEKYVEKGLKEGLSKDEAMVRAANMAQDSTVNFARRGSKTQAANAMIAFINARAQGTDRLIRSVKNDPAGTLLRLGLISQAPAALLYLHNRGFASYNDPRVVSDSDKRNNFIFMLSDTPMASLNGAQFIKIPKGDVGKFANPTEAFLSHADGKGGNFMNELGQTLGAFSPAQNFGDIIPTALKPPIENAANHNFFTGQQIVPDYKQSLPPAYQSNKNTPAIFKAAGQYLNQSPSMLQNLAEGYGTGYTKFAELATQPLSNQPSQGADINNIPMLRRFLGGEKRTQEEQQLSDQKKGQSVMFQINDVKSAIKRGDIPLDAGMQQIKNLMQQQQQTAPVKQTSYFGTKTADAAAPGDTTNLLQKQLQATQMKTQVGLSGTPAMADNVIYYSNGAGGTKTIDLNPPTKGQGIDAFANQNWNINKAKQVYSADIPQAQKDAAYKKLGVDPAKMEYEYKASKSNDVKTQYATSQAQSLTHDQLIQRLQTGRVDSLSGTKFADNTVLDNLAKNGLISYAEAASLKKIDLNSDGQPKVTSGGKGRKGLKVDFRQFTKVANIKAPRVSIVRHGAKTFKAPTIKAPVVDHPTFKQLTFKGKPLTLKKK